MAGEWGQGKFTAGYGQEPWRVGFQYTGKTLCQEMKLQG